MKHSIQSTEDLGLVVRAVRKSTRMRQDDLAAVVGVSQQFAVDVERGKATVQFGRVLRLLEELGILLNVDIPDEASCKLDELRNRPTGSPRVRRRRGDAPPATLSANGSTSPQSQGDIDLTEGTR
jgi:transcriptional regulator with XRE-family HTH domain